MTQNAGATSEGMPVEGEQGSYAGWYIGVAIIVAVFAVGIGLWFVYHP
jgi:hypothetical protein